MADKSKSKQLAVRIGMVALVALLGGALIAGLLSGAIPLEIPTRVVGPPLCEGLDSKGRQFKAETRNVDFTAITESNEGRGVVYRRAANTNSDFDVVGRLVPSNCQVGFVGFCIGEPLADLSSSQAPRDQQWFILPDKRGYVHGGVVQELPPGTIGQAPQMCDGGTEEPKDPVVIGTIPAQLSEKVQVQLRAENAATVAAAIHVADQSGKNDWHPLAIDVDSSDGFSLPVDPAGIVPQPGATLLFVVCWAGNVPGRGSAKAMVEVGRGGAPRQVTAPPDLRRGSSVACKQIAGGA